LLIAAQKSAGAVFLTRIPMGIKYMLATQCANPAAKKAVIGKRIERVLSIAVKALKQSQTARQTRVLHRMPRMRASIKSSSHSTLAMLSMFRPTALAFREIKYGTKYYRN
jgi:hypothetical protein